MKLVRLYRRLEVDGKKGKLTLKSYAKVPDNISMDIEASYASGSKETTQVSVMNLPAEDINYLTKGSNARVYGGWYGEDGSSNNVGIIMEGKLATPTPSTIDSSGKTTTITIVDGSDYDKLPEVKKKATTSRSISAQKTLDQTITAYNSKMNAQRRKWIDSHPGATSKQLRAYGHTIITKKNAFAKKKRQEYVKQKANHTAKAKVTKKTKYKPLSFAKNTKGSSIIKKIAKEAGIKIYKLKLVYDKKFTKGYTAKAKPMSAIKSIASQCKTPISYPNGRLEIADYSKNKKSNFYLNYDTGMLGEPEPQDDSDDGLQHYQVVALFRPYFTVGYIFHIESTTLSGWVLINSGTTSITDDSGTSTLDLVDYSKYKKKNSASVKKAETKDKKTKAKLDAANRKKLKEKQKKRRAK